ncbi:hypothetical protein HD806DRAFT_520183 [Xylariaceae sp. AK1471]|nr:hypothetical protein HD806DRAFT_520183 [Xylariaceae sp. AK1471]
MSDPAVNMAISLWNDIVAQLDAHTHIIKLTANTFNSLGEIGENFFRQQASLFLNGPADFFLDAINNNSVYIGIGEELMQHHHLIIRRIQGLRLPVLYPRPRMSVESPQIVPTSSYPIQSPLPMVPTSHFDVQAPQYLITSPQELGTASLSSDPLSGTLNGQPNVEYRVDGENEDGEHVKRPLNAWILYRQAHHPIVTQQYKKIHNSQVSQVISAQWKSMSEVDKQPWFDLAAARAAEHKRKYPNWSYKPRQKKAKRLGTRTKMVKTKGVRAPPQQQQAALDPSMDISAMVRHQSDAEQINTSNQEVQQNYVNPNEIHEDFIHHGTDINFESVVDSNGYGTSDNQHVYYGQSVIEQDNVAQTFPNVDHAGQLVLNYNGINQLEPSLLQDRQQEPTQAQVSDVVALQLQANEELMQQLEMEFLNLDGN